MHLNESHIHPAHLITLNFCSMSPEPKNPQKNHSQPTKKKKNTDGQAVKKNRFFYRTRTIQPTTMRSRNRIKALNRTDLRTTNHQRIIRRRFRNKARGEAVAEARNTGKKVIGGIVGTKIGVETTSLRETIGIEGETREVAGRGVAGIREMMIGVEGTMKKEEIVIGMTGEIEETIGKKQIKNMIIGWINVFSKKKHFFLF